MAAKVTLEMDIKTFKKLADYLDGHEYDIACSINDFAELTGLFIVVFDQEPSEDC